MVDISKLNKAPIANNPEGTAQKSQPTVQSNTQNAGQAEYQRLAQDLMKTHGQKLASLFGASLFGSELYRKEEMKRRKDEKPAIERILISSEHDIREVVKECLDPIYQREDIIDAITEYLLHYYEGLYEIELPREI